MASFQAKKPNEEEEGEEIAEPVRSNVKKERQFDIRWEGVPVKFRRFRDRSSPDGWRVEAHSLMPVWLRYLWPTHDFDPVAIWEKTKDQEEEDAKKERELAAAGSRKKGGGASKAAKPSKRELIQADNAAKLASEMEEKDMERLKNANKKSERGLLMTLKMSTPQGRLNQLLEILSDAVEANDKKTTFDVFWAIEALPLYQQAVQEEAAAKAAEEEEGGGSKSKEKDSKKKKDADKDKGKKKSVKRSKEAQLLNDFRKVLRKAKKLRDDEDILVFQLTEMADRLPPLSRFTTGWKLDEWQKRVLREVDKRRSAIVCAPTSSGKTVISTYVTYVSGAEGRVLFVVPTEPLVWQVAALFHKILKGQVGLCMDQVHFRPDTDLRVVVGTPFALETALSKLRGPIGEEALGKIDYAQPQGGFTFDYAVFDEVHSLDGEEGGSLQRLIRTITCNFLALSATIGNAAELQRWWEGVRGEQLNDVALVDAPRPASAAAAGGERSSRGAASPSTGASLAANGADGPVAEVYLEEHRGRFINLQRYVWVTDSFKALHPLSAVTLDMLQEQDCFKKVSLPFTPRDTYALWEGLLDVFPEGKVADVSPQRFFAERYPDSKRITLAMAKDYETALCERLEALSRELPELATQLLARYYPKSVGPDCSIMQCVEDLRRKDLCPAILFHLDSFMCLALFKELLKDLEVGQRRKYPNYIDELRKKAAEIAKMRAIAAKKRVNEKEEEEDRQEGLGDLDPTEQFVDTAAPHPDFVLSPPTSRLSSKDFEDIVEELAPANMPANRTELKSRGHPFLRALRRGIGVYIDDSSFPKYRRVVQRLAQQGKLAIIFSDESLAYGVNMPFRSCCFLSSMDNLLTPLIAQQMSGRAGRRGLDTQGSLLYMNMPWERIQYLMLGTIPAIEGRDPLYPTAALQPALSQIAPMEPFPPRGYDRSAIYSDYFDDKAARRVCGRTLEQFGKGEAPETHYLDVSREVCQALGLLDEDHEVLRSMRTVCIVTWELRHILAESLSLAVLYDKMLELFVEGRSKEHGEQITVQAEFCALLLAVIDRHECPSHVTPLQDVPFFSKTPERAERFADWMAAVQRSQDRLAGLPEESKMRLPYPIEQPLDSRVFQVVQANSFLPLGYIDSYTRFQLMRRLRLLGGSLITLHNVLMLGDPYDKLELLLRKSFMRVRYIISDAVTEESKQEDETEGADREETAAGNGAAASPPRTDGSTGAGTATPVAQDGVEETKSSG